MELKNCVLRGLIAARAAKNFARLEDGHFSPAKVYGDWGDMNWPGDTDGRIMLALALHERLSGRKSAILDEYMDILPSKLNPLGYRCDVMTDAISEQSLSGHNWMLRALLEIHVDGRDPRAEGMAKRIVENLYLPLMGKYSDYPVLAEERHIVELASGIDDGAVTRGWKTSTDVGCAFIPLDALTRFYEVFGDAHVKMLVEEMIEKFSAIDFVGINMQTHATLSALRGIMRMYRVTGDSKYLATAKRIFDLYVNYGMTDSYQNYNWFGKPAWTEPCAIVDSYIVAMELFRATQENEYAETANKILYTGFLRGQRVNGGFGCDTCAGAGDAPEYLAESIPEAYWCCTMRGAEGFMEAAKNAIVIHDDRAILTSLASGIFEFDGLKVEIRSDYPDEGKVTIHAVNNSAIKTIEILPAGDLRDLPQGESTMNVCWDIQTEKIPARHMENVHTLWKGALMLGIPEGKAIPEPVIYNPAKMNVLFK